MLGNKKSFICFASVFMSLSSCGFAAEPTYKEYKDMPPAFVPQFEVSLGVLGLRPAASNLNYVIYNKELPVQSPTWFEQEIRPNYGLAFELDGRYVFLPDNDLALEWTHLNSSTSTSVIAPNADFFLGPDYEIGPAGTDNRISHGRAQFRYDVVNLDVGQLLRMANHVVLRFFGGLSNAYLREQVNASYFGNVLTGQFAGPFSTQQEVTSDFIGLGPRFGMQGTYQADNGFGVLGEAAISALIGSIHSKTTFLSAAQQLSQSFNQATNSQLIADQHSVQVVPGFDAKLGVSYQHSLPKNTSLMIKLGYEAAVYMNAISQFLPASLVAGQSMSTGGIFVATMSHTLSNYSVQGPFLIAAINF